MFVQTGTVLGEQVNTNIEPAGFASSNGGDLSLPTSLLEYEIHRINFSGPQWEDISWFTFNPGRGGGLPSGYVGNITLRVNTAAVPEPGSLLLVGCALMLAGFVRLRRQVAR